MMFYVPEVDAQFIKTNFGIQTYYYCCIEIKKYKRLKLVIFTMVSIFSSIGKQEMDIESAAQVADAIEGITVLFGELEEKRQELWLAPLKKTTSVNRRLRSSQRRTEIGAINFANFPFCASL